MNRNVAAAFFAAVGLVILHGCSPGTPTSKDAALSDVDFAKASFTSLVNGDQSAASDIDWENFKIGPQDVGSEYRQLTVESARKARRDSFIAIFSKSFKDSGARADSLKNWTLKQGGADQSIVSVEMLAKSHMLFMISKKGGDKKLSSIQYGP